MKLVSIIVPCFNEQEGIDSFYNELNIVLKDLSQYKFSILFVNDGSTDNTIDFLKQIHKKDARVSIVDFSRNHGKEIALAAGFDYVKENTSIVVLLDADLQHPPLMIKEFLIKIEAGYDDVYAVRKNRNDESFLKRVSTKIYYKILESFSSIPVYHNAGDFRALSKNALNALKSIKEKERYTKGYYSLIGFKKYAIEFEVPERMHGDSKWNYFKLTQLAINGITSFSIAPLRIATFIGFFFSILSLLYFTFIIFKTLFVGEKIEGFPTLVCSILFLGGIQLLTIGIIGEYVGKIFNEVKNRPLYFVKEFIEQ